MLTTNVWWCAAIHVTCLHKRRAVPVRAFMAASMEPSA